MACMQFASLLRCNGRDISLQSNNQHAMVTPDLAELVQQEDASALSSPARLHDPGETYAPDMHAHLHQLSTV